MKNTRKICVFKAILLAALNTHICAQSSYSLKEQKEKVKISKAEQQEFTDFLKIKNSGIVRLINNPCDDEKIINASDDFCLNRKGFSYGSHFSFYSEVHYEKFSHLSYPSVSFIKNEIRVKNNQRLVQILVDFEERASTDVNLSSDEISNLLDFPLRNEAELRALKPNKGKYIFQKLKVTDKITPKLNHLYALRSVFLDSYKSLKFTDKETIYLFQIVRQENESLLILWRQINLSADSKQKPIAKTE